MAIAQEPTKWTMPLGVNADANDIPDTAPEYTGAASMDSVFPRITQLPLEAGGIAPTRADFNGLFKLIGESIYYLQRGGIFSYADDVDYPAGAVVKFGNGIYIAIQANGPASTVADPSDPACWRHLTTTVNNQYADSDGDVSITSVAHATSADNGVDSQGNDYIRFKNGIQLCWGSAVIANASYVDVTYPKAFISSPAKSTSVMGSGNRFIYTGMPTSSMFRALVSGGASSGTLTFNYTAMGKWK